MAKTKKKKIVSKACPPSSLQRIPLPGTVASPEYREFVIKRREIFKWYTDHRHDSGAKEKLITDLKDLGYTEGEAMNLYMSL